MAEADQEGSGLIHHSDRRLQYVSIRYTDRLAEIGAAASAGAVADSYDNAMAEALNAVLADVEEGQSERGKRKLW
ncbi:hypothetical protein JBE04_24485 [Streptomyces sp. PRKS01-29]|nr:hypothetical protein [Streptomyces sabulosicollis]